jgi:hypothetical protein
MTLRMVLIAAALTLGASEVVSQPAQRIPVFRPARQTATEPIAAHQPSFPRGRQATRRSLAEIQTMLQASGVQVSNVTMAGFVSAQRLQIAGLVRLHGSSVFQVGSAGGSVPYGGFWSVYGQEYTDGIGQQRTGGVTLAWDRVSSERFLVDCLTSDDLITVESGGNVHEFQHGNPVFIVQMDPEATSSTFSYIRSKPEADEHAWTFYGCQITTID